MTAVSLDAPLDELPALSPDLLEQALSRILPQDGKKPVPAGFQSSL